MPVAQNLSLVFGYVSVMLSAATLVATGTQFLTTLAALRPRLLRRSLTELLVILDPANLSCTDAGKLALFLTCHPSLCGHSRGAASVLRRQDFERLLMKMAAGTSQLSAKLRKSFGIASPGEACELLLAIGATSLRFELEQPAEPAGERETRAILSALGPRPLLAEIHASYGHAMARATRRYRMRTRGIAASLALALVLVLRLDLLQFFRLRNTCEWPGLTLSWILLSLGTPFWYDRLKDLLHFRPSPD